MLTKNQVLRDSPEQIFATEQLRQYMAAMLNGDERLCKTLIPTFALGCRRMTPAPAYLQTLTKPNVQVVAGGIRRVVPRGMELTNGTMIEVDAIVCATGFDVSFCPRFPLVGRKGNLQDLWRNSVPQAYMSCAVPGLPNYFSKSTELSCHHTANTYRIRVQNTQWRGLTAGSFLGTKRPHRSRQHFYADRTYRNVHRRRNSQMPNRGHQGHCACSSRRR